MEDGLDVGSQFGEVFSLRVRRGCILGLRSRIRIRRRRIRQDGVGRVRGWVTVGSQ